MTAERPLVPDGSPKPGTEEFRKAKDAINKEGWEDNAAVIIGTKEELAQRREQLEEGRETVDLRTYIQMNAVGVATSAELMDERIVGDAVVNNWPKVETGGCVFVIRFGGEKILLFKSKEGSIKKVEIEMDKIDELKEEEKSCRGIGDEIAGVINSKLKKLGFLCYPTNNVGTEAGIFLDAYSKIVQYRKTKAAKERGKGFEF